MLGLVGEIGIAAQADEAEHRNSEGVNQRDERRGGIGEAGILHQHDALAATHGSAGADRHRLPLIGGDDILLVVQSVIDERLEEATRYAGEKTESVPVEQVSELFGVEHFNRLCRRAANRRKCRRPASRP